MKKETKEKPLALTTWHATFKNKELEDTYTQQYIAYSAPYTYFFVFATGCIFFSISLFDLFYNQNLLFFSRSTIARFFVFCIAILCSFYMKKYKTPRVHYFCMTFFPFVVVTAFIYILAQQKAQGFAYQGMAIMVIIFASTIVPNKWMYSTICNFLLIAIFLHASSKYVNSVLFTDRVEVGIYLLLTGAFASVIQYRANTTRRERFWWEHELEFQSITDALTGLYNRLWFDHTLTEWCSGKGLYEDFSLVMIDIDNFKNVNDTLGHLVGDKVLIECTECIKSSVRSTDFLARWGGEEFTLLLPNVDENKALIIAEHIRETIENHSFKAVEKITCSFGVVAFTKGDSEYTLIQKADKMLYLAKNSGKNKVFSYGEASGSIPNAAKD